MPQGDARDADHKPLLWIRIGRSISIPCGSSGRSPSTARSAARLARFGYSQPAISQHLRRAETRLGTPLVVRAGLGVRFTEPGQVVARHAFAVALDAASSTLVPRLLHQAMDRIALE